MNLSIVPYTGYRVQTKTLTEINDLYNTGELDTYSVWLQRLKQYDKWAKDEWEKSRSYLFRILTSGNVSKSIFTVVDIDMLISTIKERLEFSASEVMYGNFALKFGAHSFYNILHLGARWDDVPYVDIDGQEQTGRFISWSLGYGIGTAIRLSPSWLINLEALSMHVNETEFWTNDLNLLNQLKLLFSVRTGRRSSFFAGPVGNLMLSKRIDEDSGIIGSNIMPYTLWDEINNNRSIKAWIGFNAGIRF